MHKAILFYIQELSAIPKKVNVDLAFMKAWAKLKRRFK